MCSIIGSYDKNEMYSLVKENQDRGTTGYTISRISNKGVEIVEQNPGILEKSVIEKIYKKDRSYYIVHLRTPTSITTENELHIHPTYHKGHYMWHNGLIKYNGMEVLNSYLSEELKTDFDSLALNRVISIKRSEFPLFLSDVEGLFACISVFEGSPSTLLLYRSRHATLFVNPETYTVSSIRFEGGRRINADVVYELDIDKRSLKILKDKIFKTKKFNYDLKGEL